MFCSPFCFILFDILFLIILIFQKTFVLLQRMISMKDF